jgi:tetratricopeptide (TPR) repeat protein
LRGIAGVITLQEQPLRLLTVLLERPGELITRDELRQRLWPADTYVDFEHGLNAAVKRLRDALGDSADAPRFVETVPRRGYRFIALVPEYSRSPRRWRSPWFLIALGISGMTAVAAFFLAQTRPATERAVVVLADFVNLTADPVFDLTLRQALAVQLEQSPFLDVLAEERVRETLRYMGRSREERLTPALAREICEREQATVTLAGSIAALGSHFALSLEALTCASGDTLVREHVEVDRKEMVLTALGRAAARIRRKLGESAASVRSFDVPVERATTASLEALQAFSLGGLESSRARVGEALLFYERALELDPDFALAHARMGAAYDQLGVTERVHAHLERAFGLRERLSQREKLAVATLYDRLVTGDRERQLHTLRVWKGLYPRDFAARTSLEFVHWELGNFDHGLEEAREALRLEQRNFLPYLSLAKSLIALGQPEEARAVVEKAIARGIDGWWIHFELALTAFLLNDPAALRRHVESATGQPGGWWLTWLEARTERFRGRVRRSRELNARAIEAARRAGANGWADYVTAYWADEEAAVGYASHARARVRDVGEPLGVAVRSETLAHSALALAASGEPSGARRLADELARRFPSDLLVKEVWVPSIRGAIELAAGQNGRALESLQAAARYELGAAAHFWPPYLRGHVYLQRRAAAEAGQEFQKILDHRGSSPLSHLYPLAHLGRARAAAMAGDTDASRRAYLEFLTLWKDADPDVPVLKKARAEFARLQASGR